MISIVLLPLFPRLSPYLMLKIVNSSIFLFAIFRGMINTRAMITKSKQWILYWLKIPSLSWCFYLDFPWHFLLNIHLNTGNLVFENNHR